MREAKKLTRFERRVIERVVLGEKPTAVVRELDPDCVRPDVKASKIMARPRVKAALAALEDDALHSAGVTRAWIANELRRIASANLFNDDGTPKELSKLDADTRAAIGSIKFKDGKITEVRTWNKREALSELASIAGLKREQVIAPQNVGPGLTVIVQQAVQVIGSSTGPQQAHVFINLPKPA